MRDSTSWSSAAEHAGLLLDGDPEALELIFEAESPAMGPPAVRPSASRARPVTRLAEAFTIGLRPWGLAKIGRQELSARKLRESAFALDQFRE